MLWAGKEEPPTPFFVSTKMEWFFTGDMSVDLIFVVQDKARINMLTGERERDSISGYIWLH